VCGGTGSTCTGCDGEPGSPKRTDACGKCLDPALKNTDDTVFFNTFNQSCVGCDGTSRLPPKQFDHKQVCGGGFFGAVGCTYYEDGVLVMKPDVNGLETCRKGCDGVVDSRSTYDRCGVCNGDGSTCASESVALQNDWTHKTGCKAGVYVDQCGRCGGDSSSCQGCDGVPFSGKVFDVCNVCDGEGSSCKGCDGVVNSGKVNDLCGTCDGGNLDRDVCGVCAGDSSSCAGCDSIPYSGKAVDACSVCGGNNRCKWRDGDPPPESGGSTDAVVLLVPLDQQAPSRREGVSSDERSSESSVEEGAGGLGGKGAATGLAMLVASLLGMLFVSRFRA
jgi:hypothetical protein